MITSEDVFTALYNAFHKLEQIKPDDKPEDILAAQKEVEQVMKEGSELLEKYINIRIKKVIKKMKDNNQL